MELRYYDSSYLKEFVKGVTKNESSFKKSCLEDLLKDCYYSTNIDYTGYMVYEGSRLLARCLVWTVNNIDFKEEIKYNDLANIYYIGYLDCDDNQYVFDYLMGGIEINQEYSRVKGPMDFFNCLNSGVSKNDLYDYPSYYSKLFKNYENIKGNLRKFTEETTFNYYYSRYNKSMYKDFKFSRDRGKEISLETVRNVEEIQKIMTYVSNRSPFRCIKSVLRNYVSYKYCSKMYSFYFKKNKKKLKMYEADGLSYILTSRDDRDVTVWAMDGANMEYMYLTLIEFLQEMLKKGYNVIWRCTVLFEIPYTCVVEEHTLYSGWYNCKK